MAYGKIKADTLVYDNSGSDVEVTLASLGNKAGLASPTFTGTVTIPTPAANDNTTKAASTAYVQTELGDYALKASPTFTGTVNAAALTLSGNLVVNGSTTTVSSTTIEVADKNLELGKVSTPTDISADGGGITLRGGTDKTFNWVNATDSWTTSENIHWGDGKKAVFGTTSQTTLFHNSTDLYIQNGAGDIRFEQTAGEPGLWLKRNAGIELYYDAAKKAETTSVGLTVTGTVSDSKGNLRSIPKLEKSSAHTLVAADAGKTVYISTGGVTIPDGVMSAGDAVTIINRSSSDQTITSNLSNNFFHSGASTPLVTSLTLAQRGMATIWFASGDTAYISGAGLS